MSNLTLDKLAIGKDAIIEKVECDDTSLRKHILNMGLTPGTEVTLVKTAPMGDPLKRSSFMMFLKKSMPRSP